MAQQPPNPRILLYPSEMFCIVLNNDKNVKITTQYFYSAQFIIDINKVNEKK